MGPEALLESKGVNPPKDFLTIFPLNLETAKGGEAVTMNLSPLDLMPPPKLF